MKAALRQGAVPRYALYMQGADRMGEEREKITLTNAGDVIHARRGIIKETEVRRMAVEAAADTGPGRLVMGCMPLEDMDLNVNPADACLEGAHSENRVCYVR
jgi:hypothetical protein